MTYIYVCLLGGLLGASEIIGRYSGSPVRAILWNWATATYCVINAGISAFSYLLMEQLNLVSLPESAKDAEYISKILIAGLGAAAVLRLGVSFQAAGQSLNISLMSIFEPILSKAEASIREAANKQNLADSEEIMSGLTEKEAFENLPQACMRLARLTQTERATLESEISDIRQSAEIEAIRVHSLGRSLIEAVGKEVLLQLVTSIKGNRTPKTS